MTGPAASVILKSPLTDEQRDAVWKRICELSSHTDGRNFWINDRPFVWWLGEEYENEFAEYHDHRVFGWVPQDQIGFAAMCNSPEDHLELGRLVVEFSRRYDGLISFGGLEPSPQEFEGRLWELPYENYSGESQMCHIGDTTFMEWWLTHENFSMVK